MATRAVVVDPEAPYRMGGGAVSTGRGCRPQPFDRSPRTPPRWFLLITLLVAARWLIARHGVLGLLFPPEWMLVWPILWSFTNLA